MENIKKDQIKHVAVWIAWLSVILFYLFPYIDICQIIIIAVAALYLAYTELIKKFKNKQTQAIVSVVNTADRWLAVTLLVFAASYTAYIAVLDGLPSEASGLAVLLTQQMIIPTILTVFVIILTALCGSQSYKKKKSLLAGYLVISLSFGIAIGYGEYSSLTMGVIFLIIANYFYIIDIIRWKRYGTETTKISKSFYYFTLIITFLNWFEPKLGYRLTTVDGKVARGYLESKVFVHGLSVTNLLIVLLIFVVVAGVCRYFKRTDEGCLNDSFLVVVLGGNLLITGVMYHWYVGYWELIALVYVGMLAHFIWGIDEKNMTLQIQIDKYIQYALLMIAIIYMTVKANHGEIISCVIFYAIIFIFYHEATKIKTKVTDKSAFIVIAVFFTIAAMALGRIIEARSLLLNYVVWGIAVVIFTFIIKTMLNRPDLFSKSEAQRNKMLGLCAGVIVMFSVICLAIGLKNGTQIKITTDIDNIGYFQVGNKDKQNEISSIESFWLDNPADTFMNEEVIFSEARQVNIPKGESKYKFEKSGKITINVTNIYGMRTTVTRWIRICKNY